MLNNFEYECIDEHKGNHILGVLGFTCIPCTNISGFDGIAITVRIFL